MLGLGKKQKKGSWYTNWRSHPAKTIVDKRWDKETKKLVSQRNHGVRIDKEISTYPLTEIQKSYNIYDPIEAYVEEWEHESTKDGVFINAYPKPGTRRRSDLPPLYIQWKQDWSRRLKNAKKK